MLTTYKKQTKTEFERKSILETVFKNCSWKLWIYFYSPFYFELLIGTKNSFIKKKTSKIIKLKQKLTPLPRIYFKKECDTIYTVWAESN